MSGLAARLPLSQDPDDGLALIKDFRELAKQNFLNLLLTINGERIMIPDFGVGLKQYLFEQDNAALRSELSSNIRSQTSRYLPYINILNLSFKTGGSDQNFLSISIEYNITPLNLVDHLNISREDNTLVFF